MTFLDIEGQEIRSFTSGGDSSGQPKLSANVGMNRFIWNMRYPSPTPIEGETLQEIAYNAIFAGPEAPPGTYQARLVVGGQSYTQSFEILPDPRISTTPEQFQAQFELLLSIRDKMSETHEAVNRLRGVRVQVEEWERRTAGGPAGERMSEAAAEIGEKLAAIEGELVMVRPSAGARMSARLNSMLAGLAKVVSRADTGPTQQANVVFGEVSGQIDGQLGSLQEVIDEDVSMFSNLIAELEVPAITIPPAP